tara:strand:- start:195 stop:491 length:297 start_codon:yes stop_codon:yes gene_type:complete
MKPKFLAAPIEKFFEIIELKIRYKQRSKMSLIVPLDKNSKFFLYKINIINEKSINIIFINEAAGPTIIEIGISENNKKKYISDIFSFIFISPIFFFYL